MIADLEADIKLIAKKNLFSKWIALVVYRKIKDLDSLVGGIMLTKQEYEDKLKKIEES